MKVMAIALASSVSLLSAGVASAAKQKVDPNKFEVQGAFQMNYAVKGKAYDPFAAAANAGDKSLKGASKFLKDRGQGLESLMNASTKNAGKIGRQVSKGFNSGVETINIQSRKNVTQFNNEGRKNAKLTNKELRENGKALLKGASKITKDLGSILPSSGNGGSASGDILP